MKPYTGPILKPNRDYDPLLDGDDDDFDNEIKATPEFVPLPPGEFKSIADDLQAAIDLAQSKMHICAEPEFGTLCAELKRAKDAMHDHYKLRATDVLFADAERLETLNLRKLADKEDAGKESARLRQQVSRARRSLKR